MISSILATLLRLPTINRAQLDRATVFCAEYSASESISESIDLDQLDLSDACVGTCLVLYTLCLFLPL